MSNGPQFFQTLMGRQFYEGTMPEIARQLKRVADGLEKQQAGPAAPVTPPVVTLPNAPPEGSVYKTLELSTGHVAADTSEQLDTMAESREGGFFLYPAKRNTQYPSCFVTVLKYSDYGWIVRVPEDDFDEEPINVPTPLQSIVAVLRYAQAHNIRWLVFDRDAEIIPGLTTYNW